MVLLITFHPLRQPTGNVVLTPDYVVDDVTFMQWIYINRKNNGENRNGLGKEKNRIKIFKERVAFIQGSMTTACCEKRIGPSF